MEVDQSKKQKIKMLFEEKALFEENKRRVKDLEKTLGDREVKIVRLEQDNSQKDIKIRDAEKSAEIGTLKASNDVKDQRIEEDAVVIKEEKRELKIQVAGYKKDPKYKTIQERFIESPIKGKYSDND